VPGEAFERDGKGRCLSPGQIVRSGQGPGGRSTEFGERRTELPAVQQIRANARPASDTEETWVGGGGEAK
jgi:hypothetical protein